MIIRDGSEQDIYICVALAEKFYKHTAFYGRVPFDGASVAERLINCLNAKIFAVAEQDDQVVGFACGLKAPSLMNKEYLIGAELAWWMEPEYRKCTAGVRLLKHVERMARDAGCYAWSMMCLESLNPDDVEDMYLRMGYQPSERTFVRYL